MNKTKYNSGLSLINIIIFGGIMSGLAVFMFKKQNQVSKVLGSHSIKEDMIKISGQINQILTNVQYCKGDFFDNQLVPLFALGAPAKRTLTNLDVGAPYGVLIASGDTFGAQTKNGSRPIEVDSIELERKSPKDVDLNIYFKINNADVFMNSVSSPDFRLLRQYPMKMKFNIDGSLAGCYTDPQGQIEDAVYRFCQGKGAIYDSEKVLCRIIALTPLKCPVGELLVGMDFDGTNINEPKVVPRCSGNFIITQPNLECPSTEILKGVDANGNPICKPLTSDDLKHLVKTNHLNPNTPTYEDCTSKQMKLNVFGGYIEMDCAP